jgi:hypothetical protein
VSESESLGKARLDLEVDTTTFRRDMQSGKSEAESMRDALDAIASFSKFAEEALKQVKLTSGQAAESDGSASSILEGVRGISDEARAAAEHLDNVRITDRQAAESDAAGDVIDRKLKDITGNANEARRSLESVRIAGGAVGTTGGRTGVGVGAFGSGYGRIGLVGTALGAGVLTAPAAAPAALGLLAALPSLAGGAAGAIGTLALAFDGVGKAIGGDYKAYESLTPAQKAFTQDVRSLAGWLNQLKQVAAGDMFPGLDKALHETLSPGTLNVITSAVAAFAHAIGQAGEAWGRYFGSAEFQQVAGPLLQDGARNLDVLSTAALHLFDAMGVLGRAGIPFIDWLTRGVQEGAQLADTWIHGEDASGRLATGMREAESSLRLVLGLFEALARDAGYLGEALYPVSKTAVKDLTDGLTSLGEIIQRNQGQIRDIVGGALAAFVQAVKAASAVIREVWPLVGKVVDGLGGWTHAFEILIGLKMASVINGWYGSLVKLAGAEALGGAEAKSAGLLSNLTALKLLGPIAIAVTVSEVVSKITGSDPLDFSQGTAHDVVRGSNPYPVGTETHYAYAAGLAGKQGTQRTTGSPAVKKAFLAGQSAYLAGGGGETLLGPRSYSAAQLASLWIQAGGDPSAAGLMAQVALAESSGRPGVVNAIGAAGLWQIYNGHQPTAAQRAQLTNPLDNAKAAVAKYNSGGLAPWVSSKAVWSKSAAYAAYLAGQTTNAFGAAPEFTKNLPAAPKPPVIPAVVTELLNRASANASKSKQLGNAGGTAQRYLTDELDELQAAQKKLEALHPSSASAKAQIAKQITSIENKIRDVQTAIKNAVFATGCDLMPLPNALGGAPERVEEEPGDLPEPLELAEVAA